MATYGNYNGNTYQEVREVSAGGQSGGPMSKLCGSLCTSLLGVAMYWGSLALVAHNEMSAVCVARALSSARGLQEGVSCNGDGVQGLTGPIHVACPIAESSLMLRTPSDFGADWLEGAFSAKAVKVKQKVSMLQCVEKKRTEERKQGDKIQKIDTWTYQTEWMPNAVESSTFKAWSNQNAREAMRSGCGRNFERNPSLPLSSQELSAGSLLAGAFDLSRFLPQVTAVEPIALRQGKYRLPSSIAPSTHRRGTGGTKRRLAKDGQSYTREEFLDHYGQRKGEDEWREGAVPDSSSSESPQSVAVKGNTAHTCPLAEEIGCLRVSYWHSSATHVSHLGAVASGRSSLGLKTRAWTAPPSWLCNGGSSSQVDIFSTGWLEAEELVSSAEDANTAFTWMLRLLGIVLAVVGIMMFLNPLQTLANLVDDFFDWFQFIPIAGWLLGYLGDAVAGAVGCAVFAISVGIGLPSALLVLSISWCVMRPMLGIPMVLGCVSAIGYSIMALFKLAQAGREKRKNA
mmetsp:Transcript_73483/g.132331  ORF Transcript_73483/g.132331 Transcript_73483/m.132331 type:complete len:514 (+) Transcript_73483:70-1611(+)